MKNNSWIRDIARTLFCTFLISIAGGMLYSAPVKMKNLYHQLRKVQEMTQRKNIPMYIS